MDVLLASSNQHKALEFRRIFSGSHLQLLLPMELHLQTLHVAEPGPTFADNAMAKALAYFQAYRMPVLADDSGICVDLLAGSPGVHSARFGGPQLDDAGRVAYLLECLHNVPERGRTAHYVCHLVLAQHEAEPLQAEAAWYGRIATSAVPGPTGFGYDPVFLVPGRDITASQLSQAEKDLLGHRGRAARRLLSKVVR